MVVDRKNQKALAVLYLASGLLPNAANSSNVQTKFAAEHNKNEVLEGKFRNLNFLPSTKKTTEYSFELFVSIYRYWMFFSLSQATMIIRFPPWKTLVAQKHRAVSGQEKVAFSSPVGLPWESLPLPQSPYGRANADFTTKISRIDRLPNLLTHSAPLCGLRPQRSSAIKILCCVSGDG